MRHLRRQLFKRGLDVTGPEHDAVALPACPDATGECKGKVFAKRCNRIGVPDRQTAKVRSAMFQRSGMKNAVAHVPSMLR